MLGCEEPETRMFCFSMCWTLLLDEVGHHESTMVRKTELIPSDGIGSNKGEPPFFQKKSKSVKYDGIISHQDLWIGFAGFQRGLLLVNQYTSRVLQML